MFCVESESGIHRIDEQKQEDRRQKIARHPTATLTVMEIVIILFYYLGARLLSEQ